MQWTIWHKWITLVSPSLTVRLHDSISEEGFHYLVFDLWVQHFFILHILTSLKQNTPHGFTKYQTHSRFTSRSGEVRTWQLPIRCPVTEALWEIRRGVFASSLLHLSQKCCALSHRTPSTMCTHTYMHTLCEMHSSQVSSLFLKKVRFSQSRSDYRSELFIQMNSN